MTEAEGAIGAPELRARLPDGWRVQDDGAGVYGHAGGGGTPGLVGSDGIRACFSIQPDGGLWTATWKEPHELGDDPGAVSDRVKGTRERCLAWVTERARGSGGQARE